MYVEKNMVKNKNMRLKTMTESKNSPNQYFLGFGACLAAYLPKARRQADRLSCFCGFVTIKIMV